MLYILYTYIHTSIYAIYIYNIYIYIYICYIYISQRQLFVCKLSLKGISIKAILSSKYVSCTVTFPAKNVFQWKFFKKVISF